MPRLVLRRVPAPALPSCSSAASGSSSPCYRLPGYPATSPSSSSSSWFPSDLSSGSTCASPPACASSPSSSSSSLSTSSSSYSSSSGSSSPSSSSSTLSTFSSPPTSSSSSSASSSKSPIFAACSSCSSCSSFSSTEVPEGQHWVLVPDERKFLKFRLTLVPTVSSLKRTVEPSEVYTLPQSHYKLIPPQTHTRRGYRQSCKKRPQLKTVEDVKWVRKLRGIMNERNRQQSISGTKRAAGPPQDGPPQKRSLKN